ncbi:hypothetical protein [Actinopolyspora alba]|uniref:hypothetical protein n=1 Tax=Actinopolyspora alba TaxID=673379 RepID=UPI001C31DDB0|nr:hypothetical protein [Actinopolyspora alba]
MSRSSAAQLMPLAGDVTTGWCMECTGRVLWKIENNPGYKVQSVLSRTEKPTFDTNAQLRQRADADR